MVVYKATNLINNKVYIGQTTRSLQIRRLGHLQCMRDGMDSYFYNALRRHGSGNFNWQVICICPDIDSLNEQEQYYIKYYNSMDREAGYNLTSGGSCCIMSQETKDKLRLLATDRKPSKETLIKLRNSHLGHYPTKKTRKKMSEARTGAKNCNYGKTPSKETRDKISNTIKKLWQDPVYRKHMSSVHMKDK